MVLSRRARARSCARSMAMQRVCAVLLLAAGSARHGHGTMLGRAPPRSINATADAELLPGTTWPGGAPRTGGPVDSGSVREAHGRGGEQEGATSLKYMTWLDGYTVNASQNHDWISLGNSNDWEQINEFARHGVPSLLRGVGGVWQSDPVPHPEWGQKNNSRDLVDGWEGIVEHWAQTVALPFLRNSTVVGVYIGDELCSHNIYPCWKLSMGPLLKKLRALLGSKAILYTNECESSFSNHTGPSLDKLPPELDLISFDAYAGLTVGSNASTEVDVVSGYLNQAIFGMMWPHQKVLLVPGRFQCANVMSFNQSEDKAVQKLDAYFQYAKTERRVAGFAPWHWGDRHNPQAKAGCDMEKGAGSMPRAVAKLREIGHWMKANAAGTPLRPGRGNREE